MESKEQEVQLVTSEKPKNLGRVEWGRKLGKMSKEKKKLKKEAEEKSVISIDEVNPVKQMWKQYAIMVTTGGLIGFGILYFHVLYTRENVVKETKPETNSVDAKSFPEF